MKTGNNMTLVWSFRNRINILEKSIKTADKFFPKDVNFCLIDAASDEKTIKRLRGFSSKIKKRKIRICESAYRSTVSEAWNLGMIMSDTRYVIFSSSDVEFKSKKIYSEIKKSIDAGFEYVLIENHAVFMIDKAIIPKIGWFDERFVLGPHFDTDYMIRAIESKIRFLIIPDKNYYHHSDSPRITATRQKNEVKDRLPMNDKTNEKIFMSKWKSNWKGWDIEPPPTDIKKLKRISKELDPHPYFSKKIKLLYKDSLPAKASKLTKRIPIKISHRLKI